MSLGWKAASNPGRETALEEHRLAAAKPEEAAGLAALDPVHRPVTENDQLIFGQRVDRVGQLVWRDPERARDVKTLSVPLLVGAAIDDQDLLVRKMLQQLTAWN